jgi:molybdate transport system ATP-binding protein
MDEPLAALDDARKQEILPYIERLRDETKIPIVYVSHSIVEVSRLATDAVILSAGRVVAAGPVAEVLSRPETLPPGERDETGALVELEVVSQDESFGLTVLRSSAAEWRLPRVERPAGAKVRVRVRARDAMIMTQRPEGVSALNVLPARIRAIAQGEGPDTLITLTSGTDRLLARVTRRSVHVLGLEAGREVFVVVKSVTFDRVNAAHAAPFEPDAR